MAEREDGEKWISEKLKAEASRHEPNLDRIRKRIREHGIEEPVRRSAWLLPAAAATFVVLIAGVIATVNDEAPADSPGGVQVVGAAATPSSTQAGTRTPTPAISASPTKPPNASPTKPPNSVRATSSPGPKSTRSASVDPKPSGSPTAPAVGSTPRRAVRVNLTPAQPGQTVILPGDAVDWIAAGSDSASQRIRRAQGDQMISGPHDTGNVTSTTTSSPFSVSWTGGMPEGERSGLRTWRTVTGPVDGPETGLRIAVPAGQRTATLVLYVGANGADAQLRTRLGARGKVRTTEVKATNGQGYIATIRFHTEGPAAELTVELIGGSGGSISFAAATLR